MTSTSSDDGRRPPPASSTPSPPSADACPMVALPDYTLQGEDGPVRLADVFAGRRQLITYHHMWSPGAEWQCGGCTGFTSQFTRLDFLTAYDARFVIVTQGPIDEALAYKEKVGNRMTWYSTADSSFGTDVDAPPGGGFGVNVFLRDGDTRLPHLAHRRAWHRAAQSHLPADRPAALGPPGAVAGLPGRLAAVADVRGLARLPRHRPALRPDSGGLDPAPLTSPRGRRNRCGRLGRRWRRRPAQYQAGRQLAPAGRRGSPSSPLSPAAAARAAISPWPRTSWAMVVSSNMAAISWSSTLITEMSPGTLSPARRRAHKAPMASSSYSAKTAVGSTGRESRAVIASAPPSRPCGPVATSSSGRVSPAAFRASSQPRRRSADDSNSNRGSSASPMIRPIRRCRRWIRWLTACRAAATASMPTAGLPARSCRR